MRRRDPRRVLVAGVLRCVATPLKPKAVRLREQADRSPEPNPYKEGPDMQSLTERPAPPLVLPDTRRRPTRILPPDHMCHPRDVDEFLVQFVDVRLTEACRAAGEL